ncbi:MAG: sugar ABC transporter permease [Sinobacteraceae bacterium]|nr:sugar ABC transporter permease [Nevskiaceae bacterium]
MTARNRRQSAWIFLAPMLIVLSLVAAWPLARTLFYSTTNATLIDMADYDFVGLGNYLGYSNGRWYGLLTDPQWLLALRNTLFFAFVSVAIETVLGVAIALLVNARLPGRGLMRAAMLVPWAIPTVVSAKMWAWMLNDQFGIVNDMLLRGGIVEAPLAWLGSAGLAMASMIAVDVWKATPFVAMLVLAALQTLPRDCYEAAQVDGIAPAKLFFRVTLPLIRPVLTVAVIFRLLDAMRMFDLAYVMTGTNDATMTLSVHARQQLVDFQDVGYGSTVSTTLFFMIVLVTALYVAALKPLGRNP